MGAFSPRHIIIFLGILIGVALLWWQLILPPTSPRGAGTTSIILPATVPTPKRASASNETDRVILSLFDSPLDNNDLAFEQHIRARYRNAYIGIYLLKTCNADVTTYHNALAASFAKEWAARGSEAPPAQDIHSMLMSIIEEARTSYSMLYASTPCDKRNLPAFTTFFEGLGK
jgi:hypothetical protein